MAMEGTSLEGIIYLAIIAFMFGGGFGFGGFGGGNAAVAAGMATQADMQRGFDTQNIQAQTRDILAAVTGGTAQTIAASTANAVSVKKSVSKAACKYETKLVTELSDLIDEMDEATTALEKAVEDFNKIEVIAEASEFVRDTVLPAMDKLRSAADKAEAVTAESYWPFPAYDKLLFGV